MNKNHSNAIRQTAPYALLSLVIGLGISLFNVLPVLFQDNIVQDDFNQSYFWVWKLWDPTLFENYFLVDIYQSHLVRTPIVNFIFHLGPYLTDNLIFFNKILAILIGTFSTLFAFLYFHQVTKNKVLSIMYTLLMACIFWYTDHVSNACTRCYLWMGLFAYMYYREAGKKYIASLVCFIMLLMSPFVFLLCLGMEFLFFLFSLDYKNISVSIRKNIGSLSALLFNTFSVALIYLVIFKDVKTMGKGTIFTLEEMKALPELNHGGRHPIFGASLMDGTWFTNLHWGLPVGKFGLYHVLILAMLFVLASMFLYFKRHKLKETLVSVFTSSAGVLFLTSILLYTAAQITFPLLYMPNRYIAVPWLLLSILIPFFLVYVLVDYLRERRKHLMSLSYIAFALVCVCSLYVTRNLHDPAFMKMSNEIKAYVERLPKDAVIAGHPSLDDLSLIPMVTKRMSFVDKERSIAYSKDILDEIRRRTITSFTMIFATSKSELVNLMESNGVTHILVNRWFYKKKYRNNPKYYKPYNKTIRSIISTNKEKGFYLKQLMKEKGLRYTVFSLEEIKAS